MYGCCNTKVSAQLHIVVHSKTPIIIERKEMEVPHNWCPKVYQKVVCQNLPPFINIQNQKLPYQNLPNFEQQLQFSQPQSYQQGYMLAKQNTTNQKTNETYQFSKQQLGDDKQKKQQQEQNNLSNNVLAQFLNYQPTFYNQNMFTK